MGNLNGAVHWVHLQLFSDSRLLIMKITNRKGVTKNLTGSNGIVFRRALCLPLGMPIDQFQKIIR